MSLPRVSVALPVRNAVDTLPATLASLQSQDLEAFEILLVDHASSDGSDKLMQGFAREDERIRVLRCEGSYVEACNLAWQAASGDLIARMDADDLAAPARLRIQRDYLLQHPELAGCGSRVRIAKRRGSGALGPPDGGYQRYEAWINALLTPESISRERFIDSPLPHPTTMLRREVLEAVGGYADPPWAEDYDLWLRLIERGFLLGKTPEVLLDWIDAPTRSSRTLSRYALPQFQEAKAHYLARLDSVRERGVVMCGAGPTGKDLAHRLRRHGVQLQAFLEVNPRQIGQRLQGAPVLAADQASSFLGSAILLSAVGQAEGRTRIREWLYESGFTEGEDFFCVA